ncbi:exodeoxyribonuclease V subunit beta [Candidatus Electronema sp. JM]|uniref:exodeoxyribonuclease V subunit beta n=1 Tax=Candidatus Electronema sp. JM TaxID=3401571 RepID=UPI003AA88331
MLPLDPLTLRLHGQILIEASAGTGKTYTIALLFLRLLLEQELAVDEILVVTFTKAAVEELRGRIRQRIRDALDVLDKRADDQRLRALLDKVQDDTLAQVLLNDALTRMDESAICTIDSFCRRMLKEHAFESGAPFEMELLDSEQQIRARAMEDFWRQRFYPLAEAEAAWVQTQWESPEKLLAALGGHLERDDVDCLPQVSQADIARQTAELKSLFAEVTQQWRQQRESIAALLRDNKRLSRSNSEGYGLERLEPALTQMDSLAESAEPPWLLPDKLALFTASKIDSSLLKKGKGEPPEHPFFNLFEQFWQAHGRAAVAKKAAILLEARAWLRSELSRRKQEQNQFYFYDLPVWLDKSLHGPEGGELARRIARRFPVILVDEFQDTDPLQYRIFKAVHEAAKALDAVAKKRWQEDEKAGLFLIGDPKQAIYSFRGADIFTYLQARRDTHERCRLTMTTNHRSSAAMVTAVERLFSGEAPFLFPEISFPHVAAAGKTAAFLRDGSTPPPLTCLFLPEKEAGKPLSKELAGEQAARFCAHEIALLLATGQTGRASIGGQPLVSGDIAVLVRTHAEAEQVRRELNALGIASVSGDNDSVFAAKEARQFLLLLSSLSDLSDSGLLRTVLAGDLFGWTAEQLDQLRDDDAAREQSLAAMSRYRDLWQQQGVLAMFQQLLSEQRTVSRLCAMPSGERRLTNFLHLAELLQEAAKQRPAPDALLRWFNDQMHSADGQSENQQLRLESDENLVKIVTIHKAKGMEYPLIFLPFLWSSRSVMPDGPLTFHRQGRLCLDLGSGNEEHLRLADAERLAEDLRLLYVALTRAVHGCFFCWGWIKKMEESALCRLLHQSEPLSATQIAVDLAKLAEVLTAKPCPPKFPAPPALRAAEQAVALKAAQFRGRIDTDWRIVSYSSLAFRKEDRTEQPDHDELADFAKKNEAERLDVFSFPKGAAAGVCLHAILEQISFNDASGHEAVIATELARAGFAASWLPVVGAWMQNVLRAELLPGFSLSCLQEGERLNELAFYFPLESLRIDRFNRVLRDFGHAPLPENNGILQGLMTGFIDLVFQWQGKYYLADYKSNHLGNQAADYRLDRLQDAMNEHRYDLQYLIYTVALHRFLAGKIQNYSYEQHFGGALYLFLRGMQIKNGEKCGIFTTNPSQSLIEKDIFYSM